MQLNPIIQTIHPIFCIGISEEMSLAENNTPALWSRFMQQKKSIPSLIDIPFYYSLQIYPEDYFQTFKPEYIFKKHALIEKKPDMQLPEKWTEFAIPGGLYAIFPHKGPDTRIFQEIYTSWLPQSVFRLDNRPHFEKLPKNHIPGHPDSEEAIFIPIQME
jgi:AraC family transcriptional regulator